MTALRAGVALAVIGSICLLVVLLRAEKVRLEARAEAALSRMLDARREAWNLQMEIARLRTPGQIRSRADWMQLTVDASFDAWLAADGERRMASHAR